MKKPVPLNDEILRAIGNITVVFSALESNISLFVWRLMGVVDYKVGRIITSNLQAGDLANLWRTLYTHRIDDEELQCELRKVFKRVECVRAKRNQIVHSMWAESAGDKALKISERIRRGELRSSVMDMSIEDLESIADEIADVAEEVMYFMIRTVNEKLYREPMRNVPGPK